jgi:hypothetical protein
VSKPTIITTEVSADEAQFKVNGKFLDEPRYSGYYKIEMLPDGTKRRGDAVHYKHEHILPVI